MGDTDLFPWAKWKQCVSNALLDEATVQFSRYESNKGYYPLRAALCTFLQRTRGVECSPEQIVILAGTQYVLEMILNLIPHKCSVAFEEPGFIGMRNVFHNCGYNVMPIPIQSDGLDIDILQKNPADIVYLTPSHQFPTGVITSMDKRSQLLEWAKQNNGFIIENDYDSEFHYNTHILPALQSLDKGGGHVIYIGSLSKAMFPSIRCAYCVLPEPLQELYDEKYKHFNSALPTFVQKALSEFICDGLLDKYVSKISKLNERKYENLMHNLEHILPDSVHIIASPSGSHLLLQVDCCTDESDLINFMRSRSIGIHGTKKHWISENAPNNVFILGFSSIPEDKIEKYALILASALHEYTETKAGDI